jgi:4-oxalocrotonate tautomerase
MPTVNISLFSGRDVDTKRKLVAAVTDAVVETCGVPPEAVTVILTDMEPENYAKAGVLRYDQLKK